MFCCHVRRHIGALTAVLGGVDMFVFTGGIGEKAAPVRGCICEGLGHLGVFIDPERNEVNADTISIPGSQCTVRVMPTNEDLVIARKTHKLLIS